jgi:hypothetical protein
MVDIVFETARFNLSEPKPHFINPGCFGEDVVHWLGGRLEAHGVRTIRIYQEDWGWEMEARLGEISYFVGAGGVRDQGAESPNYGQWRIFVQKRRSILDRALGKNRMSKTDPLLWMIESALHEEADIRNVRREASAA